MALCSSRTLPGHEWASSRRRASGVAAWTCLPSLRLPSRMKCSTNSGRSPGRSRSGGSARAKPLSRVEPADLVERLQTGQVRQAHVEQDDVGPPVADGLDALAGGAGGEHLQVLGLQALLQRVDQVGLVI